MPRKGQEYPLYVRLPQTASDKLERAATALGIAKKDIVSNLVTAYVDPDTQQGLSRLGSLASKPTFTNPNGPTMGTYSFQAYDRVDRPEIMNVEQAAQFLQIEEALVIQLAEAGQLPGKRLGTAWRFSRDALVAWLSSPDR